MCHRQHAVVSKGPRAHGLGVSHLSPGLLMATLALASWQNENRSADVPWVGWPGLPHPPPSWRFGGSHPWGLTVALLLFFTLPSAPASPLVSYLLFPKLADAVEVCAHRSSLFLPPPPPPPKIPKRGVGKRLAWQVQRHLLGVLWTCATGCPSEPSWDCPLRLHSLPTPGVF